MKKLRPLNDQVILKPLSTTQQKIGGIIIPDMGHEKPLMAEVIEVSKGIFNWNTGELIPHQVKVGDIVIIPKMGATVVSHEGEDYYICQAQQLLAIEYEDNLSLEEQILKNTKSF